MYYDVYLTYRHGLMSTRKAWNVMSALCNTNCNLLPKHSFSENKAIYYALLLLLAFHFNALKREKWVHEISLFFLWFSFAANKFQPIGPLVSIHVYYYYTQFLRLCVCVCVIFKCIWLQGVSSTRMTFIFFCLCLSAVWTVLSAKE
jgi:hypothetical protein